MAPSWKAESIPSTCFYMRWRSRGLYKPVTHTPSTLTPENSHHPHSPQKTARTEQPPSTLTPEDSQNRAATQACATWPGCVNVADLFCSAVAKRHPAVAGHSGGGVLGTIQRHGKGQADSSSVVIRAAQQQVAREFRSWGPTAKKAGIRRCNCRKAV